MSKESSDKSQKFEKNGSKKTRNIVFSGGTRMIIMLTMTFAFFVIEIVFGYISHSMALIADSFHMLSDVMALSVAFACLKVFFDT